LGGMLGVTGCTGGRLGDRACGEDWDGDWVAHGVMMGLGTTGGTGILGALGVIEGPWVTGGTGGYWRIWEGDWVLQERWGVMGRLGITGEPGGHCGPGWGLVALGGYREH